MVLNLSIAGMPNRHAAVVVMAFGADLMKARPAASAADFNEGAPPGAPVN